MRFVWLLCSIFPLSACDSPPAPEVTPAVQTTDSSAFDLGAYCAAMCARTAACSMASAAESASLGGAKTEEALGRAREREAELRETCVDGCQSEAVDPLDLQVARRANLCLEQSDCVGLERCLAAL